MSQPDVFSKSPSSAIRRSVVNSGLLPPKKEKPTLMVGSLGWSPVQSSVGGEAELAALLGPVFREGLGQLGQRESVGLLTVDQGYDDIPQLQEVVRAIRRAGGKINSQCGIHIHIDAAPFDGRHLGNLAKIVYKQEPLILHALGISRDRLGRYTRPVSDELIQRIEQHRPRTKDQLNRIWYGYHNRQPQHYDNSRYHGVNLHNVWYRGTVEFHWFEATHKAPSTTSGSSCSTSA